MLSTPMPVHPVYDKGTHEKLLSASFRFCEDYARTIEAEFKAGGASNNSKSKANKPSVSCKENLQL